MAQGFPMMIEAAAVAALCAGPAWSAGAETAELPAGTLLSVELVDAVHSGKNKSGDPFRARLLEGVWAQGRQALPPGTTLRGEVVAARPSGRLKGRARLELTLKSLQLDATGQALASDTLTYEGDAHAGKNVGSWLGGALQGAIYGVLFGGKEGAVIGAGAGTAAGAAGALLKGKQDVEFASGARLLFELKEPLRVPVHEAAPAAPEKPAQPAAPGKKPEESPAAKPST